MHGAFAQGTGDILPGDSWECSFTPAVSARFRTAQVFTDFAGSTLVACTIRSDESAGGYVG